MNAIQQGIFTSSTKDRLEELEQQKSELEVKMIQEEIQEPIFTREQILFCVHRFRETDMKNVAQKQQLIDSFVNAIYLYDDKIILTFNYKDGTKQITFDEVKCSDIGAFGAPQKQHLNGDLSAVFCIITL